MTDPQTPPTLEQLRWLEGWFEHLSTPGPKAAIRTQGTVMPQRFPESSRISAAQTLQEIRRMISEHPDAMEE